MNSRIIYLFILLKFITSAYAQHSGALEIKVNYLADEYNYKSINEIDFNNFIYYLANGPLKVTNGKYSVSYEGDGGSDYQIYEISRFSPDSLSTLVVIYIWEHSCGGSCSTTGYLKLFKITKVPNQGTDDTVYTLKELEEIQFYPGDVHRDINKYAIIIHSLRYDTGSGNCCPELEDIIKVKIEKNSYEVMSVKTVPYVK